MMDDMYSTEDKQWWVIEWAKKELLFVENVCPELSLKGMINPEKRLNRYAPDLVVNEQVSDLKCQQTPFFTARTYGLDAQYAVTFNWKDYDRYSKLYPQIVIYFWVDWQQLEMQIRERIYKVRYMAGVWRVPFQELKARIEGGQVPLHTYQRRRDDAQGNARDSYLFDLRTFDCLLQKEPN